MANCTIWYNLETRIPYLTSYEWKAGSEIGGGDAWKGEVMGGWKVEGGCEEGDWGYLDRFVLLMDGLMGVCLCCIRCL